MSTPTRDQVQAAPKVLLHDHLDGGLRPQTIVELAAEIGHELPAPDAESLGHWFAESADSGSLVRYLETFDHTVAVMQSGPAIARVARECVEDLAADGVVYAEVRYAPEQHVSGGLTLDEVVAAVQEGFDAGMAASGGYLRFGHIAAEQGGPVQQGQRLGQLLALDGPDPLHTVITPPVEGGGKPVSAGIQQGSHRKT